MSGGYTALLHGNSAMLSTIGRMTAHYLSLPPFRLALARGPLRGMGRNCYDGSEWRLWGRVRAAQLLCDATKTRQWRISPERSSTLNLSRDFEVQNPTQSGLSCQLDAVPAGCHADLAAEDMGQVALVGEAGLLRNPDERLAGSAQQTLCAFEPLFHDIALRPNPNRLLERAAEVIRAQTGNVGEHREREIVIEMRLDISAHPLQSFCRKTPAGRQE